MDQPETLAETGEIPSCTLDHFKDYDQVVEMMKSLPENVQKLREKSYEKFSDILSLYQEQPHLLDPHIPEFLTLLFRYIRDPATPNDVQDDAYKYMYQICKVRSYKVFVKFLPHELSDLDFTLKSLADTSGSNLDAGCWERRYILLVWMSVLVLIPFHLARLDGDGAQSSTNLDGKTTKMEQMYQICRQHTTTNDPCSTVAAFFAAKFLIRADMKDVYLEKFLEWVCAEHDSESIGHGQLSAIASILKHGKREDLEAYTGKLLSWITKMGYRDGNDFLKYKFYLKIIQRLGLVFLPPKVAVWRYQRGTRSLAMNLDKGGDASSLPMEEGVGVAAGDDDENFTVPDEIEDVIEELLQGLRSASSDCRWLSAKGVGRICNRLPKTLGDDVVGSVIEILNPLEPHEAWHGACLALAELAKRGLLLPYRLPDIVPLLMEALTYDEMKSYMPVGLNIRDAACYMCWAFARAYKPSDLKPFVVNIASALLITTSFDREINCRRAASAAFQESVGRLGNFPHGIEILTTADFFSVGLRTNAYLNISDYIGQFEEYSKPLISHLVARKVNHWDIAIRELAAKALNVLTKRQPTYLATEMMPKLFENAKSIDVNSRHGSILALGEVTLALTDIDRGLLTPEIVENLNILVQDFHKREQFRGMSGELMRLACVDFIRNVSQAKLPVTLECIESWQYLIDQCIINKVEKVRQLAIRALPTMANSYYIDDTFDSIKGKILNFYIKQSDNNLEETVRMGYVGAIGSLPQFMLVTDLEAVLEVLIRHSMLPDPSRGENPIVLKWSEARREAVKALTNVVETIGFDGNCSFSDEKCLERVFECFLRGLEEYTLDNRGDIGAWVREASMMGLAYLLKNCPNAMLKPEIVEKVMQGLAQQAVEKIDRTRGLAGRLFCEIVHHSPPVPHIPQHAALKEIFPADSSQVLWLFADHTCPLFCAMLDFPEYSRHLILGLTASMGQLTESLVKYSSNAFFAYIRAHKSHIPRIGDEIIQVFEANLLNERVTCPLLSFLDVVLSSGSLQALLDDEESTFADEIFRLVNAEIKGHKKLYKLVSSINVFCHLIQVNRLCTRVLAKLTFFLGLTHVHVRKSTAIKLYEALVIHGDTCESIPEENLEAILEILSDTDWGQPLTEVRPIRNNLCELLNIKPPVAATAPTTN
ncbi:tubulin-specific chaperone D [Culicoides brevitarsis]|uniref:tubulin-specific chaperone D n=1 Tax=Culicoides brevitarsis TaxID=469753 RepID=UPI00307C3776